MALEKKTLPLYENRQGVLTCQNSRNLRFPPHLHSDLEIIFVESGWLTVCDGDVPYQLFPGDCAVIFPGRIHSFETPEESHSLLALCPVEMAGDFRHGLLRSHPKVPVVPAQKLHRDVAYAMRGIWEISEQGENFSAAKAFVQLVLARVLPCMELTENVGLPMADLTAQVIGWISENYASPISLDILAEQLGVSKYRISRVFGEKLQTSLSDYVNRLRIHRAQSMLHGTDQDVLSICLACGYENPRTFNREFKRICGCTPREYRQRKAGEGIAVHAVDKEW